MPRITLQLQQSGSLLALIPRLRSAAADVVDAHARDLEAAIKHSMEDAKHGLLHGDHQASAPGEAPAIDTGVLYESVETVTTGALARAVISTDEKAPAVEYGDDNAPRPAWVPAADVQRPLFIADMQRIEERLS